MPKQYSAPPPMSIDPNAKITATMHTSSGAIVFEMFPSEAPNTVNNFVFLAREGFYDGVIFHRIIKGFMCQSGDPEGTGMGGPGYSFADEPSPGTICPAPWRWPTPGPTPTAASSLWCTSRPASPRTTPSSDRPWKGWTLWTPWPTPPSPRPTRGSAQSP